MLWPKASPLDLDFGLCAWAKLFNYLKEIEGWFVIFTKIDSANQSSHTLRDIYCKSYTKINDSVVISACLCVKIVKARGLLGGNWTNLEIFIENNRGYQEVIVKSWGYYGRYFTVFEVAISQYTWGKKKTFVAPKLSHSNLRVKDLSTFDFFGIP